MAIIGGNLEEKTLGLSIGMSGTHDNTEIDTTTGHLRLSVLEVDGSGKPIYKGKGTWTSDVIDLDGYKDFKKIITAHEHNGSSSFNVLTRVSDNSSNWSDWTPLAMDGTIQSNPKRFFQVRIDLFAGVISDSILIGKADLEPNIFVEEVESGIGSYIVPPLTSNTSSTDGFAFSETEYSVSHAPWGAFSDVSNHHYMTKGGIEGFLGFFFVDSVVINKYKIRSSYGAVYTTATPKAWVLEASIDTTNGVDGTWVELDKRDNQIWSAVNQEFEYEFSNVLRYNSYRIRWTENNGYILTNIGKLNFYKPSVKMFRLKKNYSFGMDLVSTWSNEGSLHRKKINRNDWIKIDKLI